MGLDIDPSGSPLAEITYERLCGNLGEDDVIAKQKTATENITDCDFFTSKYGTILVATG